MHPESFLIDRLHTQKHVLESKRLPEPEHLLIAQQDIAACLHVVLLFYPSLVRFLVVRILMPKLRLSVTVNSILRSSHSLLNSELYNSLALPPFEDKCISEFLLAYLPKNHPPGI